MAKPRLLDLFCSAGGASMGYHRAGFDVAGVDICDQPNYLFKFHRHDALDFVERYGREFDAIHASPPCQGYSRMNTIHKRSYPMLIEQVRELLINSGLPYVIENVEGAPLIEPVLLCGTMFGLKVLRHRLFETSHPILTMEHGLHVGEFYSPTGHGDPNWRNRRKNPHLSGKGYTQRCRDAMGIQWMNRDELAQAIPPAYTEWIGRQIMEALHA